MEKFIPCSIQYVEYTFTICVALKILHKVAQITRLIIIISKKKLYTFLWAKFIEEVLFNFA